MFRELPTWDWWCCWCWSTLNYTPQVEGPVFPWSIYWRVGHGMGGEHNNMQLILSLDIHLVNM